jgi:hypothetical protein
LNLTEYKDVATIVGVAVALVTLLKVLVEYTRSSVLRRVEYVAKIKDQFLRDATFAKITELLETDDRALKKVDPRDKWRYLYFFEEVALLLRARLIHDKVACYMFGYYAVQCDRSRWFWCSFPKKKEFWLLFFDFVERMKTIEEFKRSNPRVFLKKLRP